jgi:hypothetical protein
LNQHLFQSLYYSRPSHENGTGNNIFDLARHRVELSARFPEVDDILERLSSDPRTALEANAGT